ncbi:alpha-protein kinase 1 isoform X1 [Takifugu flavidus]|uniref:Alpha-protein kinase 1 n=2 Tax=Takifugu TaxID=31032 RepID=A0A5C6N9U5_9TELE|nr:alpha-protein kinase 1 isoform X1 [Takifugu flavidus]XP_056883632.1 alpha-protein kinase 1 isoform X1 [Takifugu flavidus]XP_056883633.1 alpha-protein kinase 1 isoform X1 [Takifugu flavidus]XP_056883634.1 alpha-protein kinase 1 isoform X1 [Takifugu flavidus]XP_056883636.1 alpha-protein kinase 1 isoform X1 [Takifugu flavidus]TWW63619.1 Alpha-protein kinase 1 [Takifugu flavidus]
MADQDAGDLLEQCVKLLETASQSSQPTEAEQLIYCNNRDFLCPELAFLLQDAVNMKWPFVPEKWQYKQIVSPNDKTNLSDLIGKHLLQLLALLKTSIAAQEASTALAVVFLVDRFLYWKDESSRLLKITKLLHRRSPHTPVAPQLIIRQARVYLNSGKLQKAEYILSSLIYNSGATGCWVYHSESDRALVQAVSVQVRGMILQKLGLWREAAELIWASLVGYYALPKPDKKGIGTSLGLLANILVSMSDEDYQVFRTNPDIDLSLLGDRSHRLLSAAQAAKMAVVYSQYTSLYVLTNAVAQGTCLLSYSFSMECPIAKRQSFLLEAQEAFTIGLLTKEEGELVASKQELHTFLKAAYSLAVTHKWHGSPPETVAEATRACLKALAQFYDYDSDAQNKDALCAEIMHLIVQVKKLLIVEPFKSSEPGSFIPDGYGNMEDTSVNFTLEDFARVMRRFKRYHASLCEANNKCKRTGDEMDGTRVCITALGTTVEALNTAHCPESSPARPQQKSELCATLGSTEELGSSWQNFPNFSASPANKTRAVDGLQCINNNAVASSTSNEGSEKIKLVQAGIETLDTDGAAVTGVVRVPQKSPRAGETLESLSQLVLRTSSSSLSGSFNSQSSWEKIDFCSPTATKPYSFSSMGMVQRNKSVDSDGSFHFLETLDSESADSAQHHTSSNHTSLGHFRDLSQPQLLESHHAISRDSASVKPAPDAPTSLQPRPGQLASTEISSESSFEMLQEGPIDRNDGASQCEETAPGERNHLCYHCINGGAAASAVPERQYSLSLQDYQALLAGVCHQCMLKRFYSEKIQFKLKEYRTAYSALHLKFSKATGLWTAKETGVYVGETMGLQGKQRAAIWLRFLHQEERLSSYVGKDYLKPKEIQFHLNDVERQMTAQHYVTEFNKSLYDKDVMAQIFFIPSEALLILNGNEIVGCVTVEPFMLGEFVKLTNNTGKKDRSFQATDYGLAFGHFTYLLSRSQEVVVDLQGWVTANGKGLTYLTDPQIHSTKTPKGPSNFAARGLQYFLDEQHGPECNSICQLLKLPPLVRQTYVPPH